MALAARDMPITRDMVAAWIEEARAAKRGKRTYVRQQIMAMDLEDPYVDVRARSDVKGARAHVADLIVEDLDSYA